VDISTARRTTVQERAYVESEHASHGVCVSGMRYFIREMGEWEKRTG
jgi:hypothetical protein